MKPSRPTVRLMTRAARDPTATDAGEQDQESTPNHERRRHGDRSDDVGDEQRTMWGMPSYSCARGRDGPRPQQEEHGGENTDNR